MWLVEVRACMTDSHLRNNHQAQTFKANMIGTALSNNLAHYIIITPMANIWGGYIVCILFHVYYILFYYIHATWPVPKVFGFLVIYNMNYEN